MRQFIFILLFFLPTVLFGQTARPTNFKIEIEESSMFFDNVFVISQDSLTAKKTSPSLSDYNDKFFKTLSSTDIQSIIDALKNVDFRKIEKEYVDNTIDDAPEYNFKITIDGQIYRFHINHIKVDSIFNLVKQINGLLPDKIKIGYNDAYFK